MIKTVLSDYLGHGVQKISLNRPHRLNAIVPELLDEYSAMVRSLTDRFYSGVSRYTTSGFLRIKLGEALEKRGVAAHIFESADEAQSDWRNVEGSAPRSR